MYSALENKFVGSTNTKRLIKDANFLLSIGSDGLLDKLLKAFFNRTV